MSTQNITIFNDLIGRTLIGEKIEETDSKLVIKNPAILQFLPIKNPDGSQGISIQFIPVLFRDFLAEKDSDVVFRYNKDNITLVDPVVLDLRVYAQYQNAFGSNQVVKHEPPKPPQQQSESKVIKLFDN